MVGTFLYKVFLLYYHLVYIHISFCVFVFLCGHASGRNAGARNVGDLARISERDTWGRNTHRDMLRKLLRGSHWPKPYVFQAPCWDKDTGGAVNLKIPVWLPHELIDVLSAGHDVLLSSKQNGDAMDVGTFEHLLHCAAQLGCKHEDLLACGLWIDGVPLNKNRSESIEVFTMSFPGLPNWRLPLAAIPKKYMLKDRSTHDAILRVICWSFEQAAVGFHPNARHDGQVWDERDKHRQAKARRPLPRGVLTEVRGDWSAYKSIFRLPGWNDKRGCCWLCPMTPDRINENDSNAFWRHDRRTHWQVLERILKQDYKLSPIFDFPFFKISLMQLDWLHIVDLGVALDFIGGLFHMLLPKLGRNQKEQVQTLHSKLHKFYRETNCSSRIAGCLTYEAILKPKAKFAKFRAKASEARDLIPFCVQLVQEYCVEDAGPEEEAAKNACWALHTCYQHLSRDQFTQEAVADNAQIFAQQYNALHEYAKAQGLKRWGLKPKLHLFMELATFKQSSASLTWTYADEDFGGLVAGLSARRGGSNNPLSVGLALLNRYAALNDVSAMQGMLMG